MPLVLNSKTPIVSPALEDIASSMFTATHRHRTDTQQNLKDEISQLKANTRHTTLTPSFPGGQADGPIMKPSHFYSINI